MLFAQRFRQLQIPACGGIQQHVFVRQRTEETYGEDTYLSSKLGAAVVRGLQGEDLATDHTVASELKHYTGYGNPIGGLNCAPTTMGRHDVFSYCMPVFEEAFVKAGATDTMCSYNSIDGFPVVSDHEIL